MDDLHSASMSYANVAATNAPPPSQQPHPDPALLNTTPPTHSHFTDDATKVNIVAPDFKQTTAIETQTPSSNIGKLDLGKIFDDDDDDVFPGDKPRKPRSKRVQDIEAEGVYIWEVAKHYLIRPGVAGGLIGIVNIGIFGALGRTFYTRPDLRRDATAISSAVAASIGLLSLESYAAETYRQTPRGREEERRAKQEGALIFRHLHEQIMRPGVLGGIVGIVNTAILGTVGYVAYSNWNRPWDRRTVSAISVGLLTLWGGEGFVAEKLSKSSKHRP